MPTGERTWSLPARWLTGLCVAAVIAVNVVGLWGIAVARRGTQDELVRLFELDTTFRAAQIESRLLGTRADLAFLAGSSAASRLEGLGRPGVASDDEWRRLAAEAVLVFLRGHPDIARLSVRSLGGHTLVRTGRRGGVPVLWTSDEEPSTGAAPRPEGAPVQAVFDFGGTRKDAVRLVADVEPAVLFEHGPRADPEARRCSLTDSQGGLLVAEPALPGALDGGTRLSATATLRAEGWTAPGPWSLRCEGHPARVTALLDPVASRYRLTLGLNLGVMALAVLLGSFAVQQARGRERLEARAREERRIRELERQLFHADRLSTVGRLAAGLAHEINNPLEGMSNYLTLAGEDLGRGDTASAARRLDGVREGMNRVAGTVRQVLAQAEPGAAPRTAVEVEAMLAQTLEFVRSRSEFRGITLSHVPAGDPLVVQASAVMLGQVLLNLVINACEAQPLGGEVELAAARRDGQVVIEVKDRGPGIVASDLPRVFEPFFSTKKSTGLGLAICQSIVREHEGDLTVENRAGGGAVFRVSLPAHRMTA